MLLHLQSLGDLRLSGPDGDLLRRRRKELAMLVVIAARAPKPVRREELQALFWGERDEQRARHSLRQALLRVRQACGDDLLDISLDTLRVSNGGLVFDARQFSDAVSAGRFREAVELWTGDLLVGCEDVGGEEFRSWLDGERPRLRRMLYTAFERLVAELEAASDWTEMASWSAQWVEQFSVDELAAARHIEALCHRGNATAASAERAAFMSRLERELDEEPSAEWLAQTHRSVDAARAMAASTPAPVTRQLAGVNSETTTVLPTPAEVRARSSPRVRIAVAAVTIAVLGISVWRLDLLGRSHDLPRIVLAVGHIEARGLPDSAAALPSLLAINLSRAPALAVLSEGRVQEVRVQMRSRDNAAADLQRAARAAGADQVIEGVLARRADGTLRLDLRRIDLASNASRAAYSVESADLNGIVDKASERIARDLGVELSTDRSAGTRSLSATRLYEEGLRAYFSMEEQAAARLFRAALAEDSTFAMAAYYASRAPGITDRTALLQQARRMARRGSDRDRLLIETWWLLARDEPTQLAVAETLAIRYPAEPAAHFWYARTLVQSGRFIDAVPPLRQTLRMDSLSLRGEYVRCLACDAYSMLSSAYVHADSLPAAERTVREWVAKQPRSAAAWGTLAHVQMLQGRYRESMDNAATALGFDRTKTLGTGGAMDLWIRMGDFETADRFWSARLATPGQSLSTDALDAAVSSLRTQGRLLEALDAAMKLRRATATRDKPLGTAFPYATVLADLGRHRETAALYDSISAPDSNDSEARKGRNRAWFLAHAATAVAALNDTAQLRRLEDTIRVRGAQSGFRRDQLLHHYVRGLRLRLAGKPALAVEEFRRSLFSPVEGNTRASFELARTLLDLDRAAEAARVLTSARSGPIGAAGQYVTRTHVEALLARALDRNNQRDSAVAHYAYVLNAWKKADPSFHKERREIQDRVRQLASR